MNLQLLLKQISMIAEKDTLLNRKTGKCFNMFNLIKKSENEIFICRLLHELLSPIGSHYQGNIYLKLFVENVLGLHFSEFELLNAKVYREYVIDHNRRIDLVIETSKTFIPIEVKVYAPDQPKQCYDYYLEAEKHMLEPKVYYLTLFGHKPSEVSAEGLIKTNSGYKEIQIISFAEHILDWLKLCAKESFAIAPIRETILQFMSVIRQLTDQMEEDLEVEVKNLLLSSSENMRSAIAIQNSLEKVKEDIIKKLFVAVDTKVGKERILNEYDFGFENYKNIRALYKRNPAYFGISYLHKTDVKQNVDIWVRMAIEEGELYIGYCCPVNQKVEAQMLSEQEIKSILGVEPKVDNWWAYWEFCPNEEDCPDFVEMNDAYFNLFDKAYFDKVVDLCTKRILSLLHG